MSGVKDVFKNGWHPDKGTTLKKQVTGVFRKGESEKHSSHSARPITDLRDPSSFGPPPKHVAAHGGTPTLPPPTQWSAAGSSRSAAPVPDGSEAPTEPPRPYRVNTTGLSTDNLPAPPVRRAATTDPLDTPPPPYSATASKPAPPRLPPRLPPRSGTGGSPTVASPQAQSATSPSPPPSLLNQGAVNRLGAAGVSVPGLGIGSGGGTTTRSPVSSSQMSGLQTRFAKLGASSGAGGGATPPPSEGTTFAEKQAAMQTAANFRKDPTSVSVADARAAALTANNFRQRHGDQVASGLKSAQSLNQKYGVTDRVSAFQQQQQQGGTGEGGSTPPAAADGRASPASAFAAAGAGLLGKKKPAPPPPPPRKKPELSVSGGNAPSTTRLADDDAPPPVPLSTRPTF